MNKKGIAIPLLGLAVALGLVAFGLYNVNRMPTPEYPELQPAFSLHSINGPLSMQDLHGKVGLIFFGYAHCPDVCPTTLINLNNAMQLLTVDEKKKVRALFITLDPKRDTPEVVAKYAQFFSQDVTGLSGSVEEIKAAAKAFLVAFDQDDPNRIGNYTMNHSTYIFVTRPDGALGNLLGHQDAPEKIAETARYWMQWAD